MVYEVGRHQRHLYDEDVDAGGSKTILAQHKGLVVMLGLALLTGLALWICCWWVWSDANRNPFQAARVLSLLAVGALVVAVVLGIALKHRRDDRVLLLELRNQVVEACRGGE